jgi:hypothetical protein
MSENCSRSADDVRLINRCAGECRLTDPITVTFSEPVHGVTTSSLLVVPAGSAVAAPGTMQASGTTDMDARGHAGTGSDVRVDVLGTTTGAASSVGID